MPEFLRRLNIVAECRDAHVALWSCPPFLFVVMGIVNIVAMVASYVLASRLVAEPQAAALIVIAVALVIFIIGNFVIQGFHRIAEANRIKSEFIAIVSHQLRSPLSVFKWTIDALSRSASSGQRPDGGMSYLEILRENSEKMIQLVNMLLEVSRIEAGRLVLRRDPVRLDAVTEAMVRSFSAYARASNVMLDFAAPRSLPPVRGDAEKVKMIVQNLIDNAIRYSPGGRIAITIRPIAAASVEWKIHDSGVGIPYEQQRYVFQKFFRSANAVTRQTSGSGLGLYIARSLITALDGEIGFSSEPGRGSAFWFRLPMHQVRDGSRL